MASISAREDYCRECGGEGCREYAEPCSTCTKGKEGGSQKCPRCAKSELPGHLTCRECGGGGLMVCPDCEGLG